MDIPNKNPLSFISGISLPADEAVLGSSLRRSVLQLILKDYPKFTTRDYISGQELSIYRRKYLHKLITGETRELNKLEKEVVQAITEHTHLTTGSVKDKRDLSLGQRMADKIATFGGSWTFILTFFGILTSWIILNAVFLQQKPFDPYPFILLNLILSCLAAIQAPIIMMSQNRQEEKDRTRAEDDYKINLKAEMEIRTLHEKMDHLIEYQNRRVMEMQEIQIEYMEDLIDKMSHKE